MDGIVPKLSRAEKRKLSKRVRRLKDAVLKTRYLIVLNLAAGETPVQTAKTQQVSRSTVYNVAQRYRENGEAGLVDRREENGETKLDERYLTVLYEAVASCPQAYGWPRPTWTREMLVETLEQLTGVRIHVSTMSDALKQIGARRGRPKPTVGCPWSNRAKRRRLRELERLLASLDDDEVALYQDEVDIHLNPKIGLDWMVRGQQKEVLTPGKNEKRYLAGAMNAKTGELIWVEGEKKNSPLFLRLLWKLHEHYSQARRIHVILDNYSIHHTQQVQESLQTPAGKRIELHFLPPYCPDHNKIERLWQDLHACVTRNHRCESIAEVLKQTHAYLTKRSEELQSQYALAP